MLPHIRLVNSPKMSLISENMEPFNTLEEAKNPQLDSVQLMLITQIEGPGAYISALCRILGQFLFLLKFA